jgi:hypothetical protein
VLVGPTGIGKSYSALRLAELMDPAFTIARVVFSARDFLRLINEDLPKGTVILWDEMGIGMAAREWYSILNKSVSYVLQSFRFKNLIILMTVPDPAFIDSQARRLYHWWIECVEIVKSDEIVIAKPFMVDHSARFDRDYMKYPIVKRPEGPAKVGTIPFRLPSSELRRAYEAKRKGAMDALYADLSDSLELGGSSKSVPPWAWKALLYLTEDRSQLEVAGILGVSRVWTNQLVSAARAALGVKSAARE